LLALVGCAHRAAVIAAPPRVGVAIAIYQPTPDAAGYAVVDDRRWIDVAGDRALVIDDVDPSAELASLVVEALAGPRALRVGACTRDQLPSPPPKMHITLHTATRGRPASATMERVPVPPRFVPTVRCAASGPPGRYLVRALYVSPSLHARVRHDLAVAGDGATTLVTRVAIETPARRAGQVADVAVFDGPPGRAVAPVALARGEVRLDGSIAVLAAPQRTLAGQLARIAPVDPSRAFVGADAPEVWVSLVLPHVALAAGAVHVHVANEGELRDVEVAMPTAPADPKRALRLPLWRDDTLRVARRAWQTSVETIGVRVAVSVINTGETEREVWVEQRVPPVPHLRVERAFPAPPVASGDVLRERVVVPAGSIASGGYMLVLE
jgi:hypothetical protein